MEQTELAREVNIAAAKAAPIAGGLIYAHVSNWGPQEWSYVLICGYVVLQAAYLIWKWRREAKKK